MSQVPGRSWHSPEAPQANYLVSTVIGLVCQVKQPDLALQSALSWPRCQF
jgi:hypothetical protein